MNLLSADLDIHVVWNLSGGYRENLVSIMKIHMNMFRAAFSTRSKRQLNASNMRVDSRIRLLSYFPRMAQEHPYFFQNLWEAERLAEETFDLKTYSAFKSVGRQDLNRASYPGKNCPLILPYLQIFIFPHIILY